MFRKIVNGTFFWTGVGLAGGMILATSLAKTLLPEKTPEPPVSEVEEATPSPKNGTVVMQPKLAEIGPRLSVIHRNLPPESSCDMHVVLAKNADRAAFTKAVKQIEDARIVYLFDDTNEATVYMAVGQLDKLRAIPGVEYIEKID